MCAFDDGEGADNYQRPDDPMPTADFLSEEIANFIEYPDAPDVPWRIRPLAEVGTDDLMPHDVVQGILTLPSFSKLEERIVGTLSPARNKSDMEAMAREDGIAGDRIGERLRPRFNGRNFHGTLLNGMAIVLPFDAEMAVRHNPRLAGRLLAPGKQENPPQGLNVLFTGILRSTRAGTLGRFCVEATYSVKKVIVNNTVLAAGRNYLQRTVGGLEITDAAGTILEEDAAESAAIALLIARNALRGPRLGRSHSVYGPFE